MSKTPYRAIELTGLDIEPLELDKVSSVKNTVEKEFIYLDKLPNGKWRLVYTEKTIPYIKQLEALTILRKD